MPDDNHVQWDRMTEDEFNRYANALLVRHHRDDVDHEVWVPNGRGGDDGVDVGVRRRQDKVVERIYQLKFFQDGFAGNLKTSRERQVKKSWDAAIRHHPELRVWAFVAPSTLTPGERRFVERLRQDGDPSIEVIGPPELDIMLARYPEIHDFATRRPVEDALRRVGMENAAVKNVDDVAVRAGALAKAADALSLYWGIKTETDGGVTTTTYFPKRSDAAEREPISFRATLNFTDDQRSLKRAWERAKKYGSLTPIRLGPEIVERVEVQGPDWARTTLERAELQMGGSDTFPPIPVEVRAISPTGVARGSLPMVIDGRASGRAGVTIHLSYRGSLDIVMTMRSAKLTGRIDFASHYGEQPATDGLAVIRFVQALEITRSIALVVPGGKPSPMDLDGKGKFPKFATPDSIEFIDDLAFLERELGVTLPFPSRMFDRDRVAARFARRMLEGRIVMHPFINGFNVTLNGKLDDALVRVLTGKHQVVATDPDFTIDLLGIKLGLGDVTIYAPVAEAVSGVEHLAALRAGKGEDRVVHVEHEPGSGFVAFSASRLADPNVVARPEPWAMRRRWEHKGLRTVQAQVAQRARDFPHVTD